MDPIEKVLEKIAFETAQDEKAAFIKESGDWKHLSNIRPKDGGTFGYTNRVFHKESGTWELYFKLIPDDLIGWYDGDLAVATDYTLCDGTSGTPDLIDAFPRSESAHGAKAGSNSHTPASTSLNTSTYSYSYYDTQTYSNTTYYARNHYHSIGAHSHGSSDHIPPYLSLQPVVCNGKILAGFTLWYRGSVVPNGWSLRSDADGKYLRGKSGSGTATGGAETHSHYQAINTGGASSTTPSVTANSQQAMLNHTHTANHYAYGNNNPAHVELLVVESDTDDAPLAKGHIGILKGATVPTGWGICNGLNGTPDYTDVMLKCNNASFSDVIIGNDVHADIATLQYTGYSSGSSKSLPNGSHYLRNYNHRHEIPEHTHGAANNNLPVHTPVLVIIKL